MFRAYYFLHMSMSKIKSVLPVLDYGDTLYTYVPVSVLKPLDAIFHSALPFVTDSKPVSLCWLVLFGSTEEATLYFVYLYSTNW